MECAHRGFCAEWNAGLPLQGGDRTDHRARRNRASLGEYARIFESQRPVPRDQGRDRRRHCGDRADCAGACPSDRGGGGAPGFAGAFLVSAAADRVSGTAVH
ncbi:hypothetical protein QU38_00080, partial [Staphylococcus aureus]